MIVITGATGHVGTHLLAQLAKRGQRVRAMTRRPPAAVVPAGVEVVYGDATDPASLPGVFAGAEAFILSAQTGGGPEGPTQHQALLTAAAEAGVGHVVALSVYDGGDRDDVLGAWHRQAEAPGWTGRCCARDGSPPTPSRGRP
jgi:uncharacterized protein YbjT (DUF2867 family)